MSKTRKKADQTPDDVARQIAEFRDRQWIEEQLRAAREAWRQAFQGVLSALEAHVQANDSAGIIRCAQFLQAQEATLQRALSYQAPDHAAGAATGEARILGAFAGDG